MLKRTRPISPPPPPFLPFDSDINIAEFSRARRQPKRTRTTATPTPETSNTRVQTWTGHGHGYHSTSSLSKRRRSPEAMEEDNQDSTLTGSIIKRRRTVAPSLEGKSRGWNPPLPPTTSSRSLRYSIDGDEEDYDFNEDTDERIHSHDDGGEEWKTKAGEYRDANTLLHDLHSQNRHRIHPPSIHNYPLQPSPSLIGNDILPSSREWDDSEMITSPDFEFRLVKERYEERNKLLGSLFLSRRRDLGDTNNRHFP